MPELVLTPMAIVINSSIAWRAHNSDNPAKRRLDAAMKTETIEIPATVLSSVETLDELQDWLIAQNPRLVAELRAARQQDLAGKFKPWTPRHLPCPSRSK